MLKPHEFKSLCQTNSFRTVADLLQCWGVILGSLYVCHETYYFIPVAVILISSRLHALTLILHDGAHYLLHKNEYVNDFLSNMFCSFPLMISTEVYRKTHLKHHQYTQTMQDPNFVIMQREEAWHYPKPAEEIKKSLIRDFFLLTLKDHMVIFKDWQVLPNFKKTTRFEKILFPLYLVSVVSLVQYFHVWPEFFILQLASLFVNPLARVRAMSEHIHQESKGQSKIHKLQETPSINAGLFERFFFAPFNTNRHLEHHLYPTIPYYNLEKTHDLIKNSQLYQTYCLYELDGYFFGNRTSFKEVLSENAIPKKEIKAA